MLHKTLEGLKYKHSSAFLCFIRKVLKTAYCTSNCTSQQNTGHQLLLFTLIPMDKKDIKDNMPAPYETQGLQAFFIMGQNRDENGHKCSPGASATGHRRSAMPYSTALEAGSFRIDDPRLITASLLPSRLLWPYCPVRNHTQRHC